MTDIRFYHLERQSLDDVLPKMLQTSLERGWRCVVQAGSEERVEHLAAHLWTFSDESFLPHGSKADGSAVLQPIWLTTDAGNPNGASVRFLVDGARAESVEGLERAVFIFDGNDEAVVKQAREDWRRFKAGQHEISYWQQDEGGRWINRATA
ncbi:DNA polymerase III subunit chi [Aestuariivirga sp.]|uniref:DNA polymerase III subunit chi n=1 Tax=Aestuariivirga sp. TaxID=2650926 RepID=UPI0039E2C0EC